MVVLKAPFPYFGGKSRAAPLIWQRLGDVQNYVEPFAGSLAVLLAREKRRGPETVNDIDGYLANFWRALQADPDGVARHCDWPVNELDLHARHQWLIDRKAEFTDALRSDPDFFDVKVAGWWVWGASAWIGDCWARSTPQAALPHLGSAGMGVHRASLQIPHLGSAGMGVHRASLQIPHLGDAGRGVHRASLQIPHLGNAGMGVHRASLQIPHLGNAGRGGLLAELQGLAQRLRYVRVCCGDWSRVMGDSVLRLGDSCGIVLDPPYDGWSGVYAEKHEVAHDVRAWAIEHGTDLRLRIALCGYDDFSMPDGWTREAWKAAGGYGSQGDGDGRANASRERIWFSPGCLAVAKQGSLW